MEFFPARVPNRGPCGLQTLIESMMRAIKRSLVPVLACALGPRRVSPPDPRPEGRESRLFFDFLGRESPEAKKGEKGPRVGSSGREFASNVTPVAGLILETKNRAIFLERIFGRGITAREQLSRAVILARF